MGSSTSEYLVDAGYAIGKPGCSQQPLFSFPQGRTLWCSPAIRGHLAQEHASVTGRTGLCGNRTGMNTQGDNLESRLTSTQVHVSPLGMPAPPRSHTVFLPTGGTATLRSSCKVFDQKKKAFDRIVFLEPTLPLQLLRTAFPN